MPFTSQYSRPMEEVRHCHRKEDMLEIHDIILTPEDVCQTRRHVDQFADWMRKDHKKGECLRADLVRSFIYIRDPSFAASTEVSRHVHEIRVLFGANISLFYFPLPLLNCLRGGGVLGWLLSGCLNFLDSLMMSDASSLPNNG